MKARVVDASVVAAAFFQEEHGQRAQAILAGDRPSLAPDLLHVEVANVIWKRFGRREIDEEEAGRLLADVLNLPLRIAPSEDLVETALLLAMKTGRTVYDCLYLALALVDHDVLVTADRRFVNALAGTPLAEHIAWLGDSKMA